MSNKIKMIQIKSKTYELRKCYQVPYLFAKLVYELDQSDEQLIKALMIAFPNICRIRNFYKDKEADKRGSDELKKFLQELGLLIDSNAIA